MQNDQITLKDLSVFSTDGNQDVFSLIDYSSTLSGRRALKKLISHPPDTYEKLVALQATVQFWALHLDEWPETVTNGTLVMLEKFFESADSGEMPPRAVGIITADFIQKLFNRRQYFLTRFSVKHISDFLKGCVELAQINDKYELPTLLKGEIATLERDLGHRLTGQILSIDEATNYNQLLKLNFDIRREMKSTIGRLMQSYALIDSWRALAKATVANKWVFPKLLPAMPVVYRAVGLRHPLLSHPVSYDLDLGGQRHFMAITGANMSGKTTFMRSIGVAALLAHIGMGVPAEQMQLSFLEGIVTNMHVEDNILKGESYFFAEVQRMKQTALKLLEEKPMLVLMDELFKGTNVHDAFECTKGVIAGLLEHTNHLLLLSTHLYEVAKLFEQSPQIVFYYFVTETTADGNYRFTYELKDGISNDRIGYRILQNEGVIDLLHRKKQPSEKQA